MRKIHRYKLRQTEREFRSYLFKRAKKRKGSFYSKLSSGAKGSIYAKEIRKYKACRLRKKTARALRFDPFDWWRSKKFMQELKEVAR